MGQRFVRTRSTDDRGSAQYLRRDRFCHGTPSPDIGRDVRAETGITSPCIYGSGTLWRYQRDLCAEADL
ncbi:MAG: hypothetical protein Q4C47_05105, partial [Planctomycetia bacterium]|nr:hypothetical protein [Planctomycetia bacterium]